MAFRFAESADNHGIDHERSKYVVEHCGFEHEGLEDIGDAVFCFGDDASGIPLEVGVINLESGDVLVIHAMRLRPKYQRYYEEALPWRR